MASNSFVKIKLFVIVLNILLIYHLSLASKLSTNINANKINKNVRAPGDKVEVTIYYETLNIVTRTFFIEQFKPVLDNVFDIIEVDLVPYGNSTELFSDEGAYFECPYGEPQCFANKIQACAIRKTNYSNPDVERHIAHFVYCMFKNRDATDIVVAANTCANRDFVDEWSEFLLCARGDPEGDTIYREMGNKTLAIADQLANLPIIEINEVIDSEARDNLLKAVCDAYQPLEGQEKPVACNNTVKAPKVNVTIYYETLDANTRDYFRRQIGPFYHLIEELVNIDFVPYGNTQLNTSDGGNVFTCPVGGREQCVANKLQALIVKEFLENPPNGDAVDGVNRAVNFISCMFANDDWIQIYSAGEQCAHNTLPIDIWPRLLRAAQDPSTDSVLQEMRERTEVFGSPLPNLPFATIEGMPSIATVNDFVQQVCATYTGTKPDICAKIEIHFLYETLHHASRLLFIEEIRTVFDNFQSLIDFKFIPAGRATHIGNQFVCPGGTEQCNGNMLQACVLDMYYNDGNNWTDPMRQEVFDFLWCMFRNKNAATVWEAAEQCAEQYIEVDPWRAIHACYELEGPALLEMAIQETQSLGLNITELGVPIVLIDGNYSVNARYDLIEAVCDHFDYEHTPARCVLGKAPTLEIVVYYEALSQLSLTFISKQLAPYYVYIEPMVNITLIPVGNVMSGNVNSSGQCEANNNACIANKIQAVVLDLYWLNDDDSDEIDGSLRSMQFLNCVFTHPNSSNNVYYAGERCAIMYLPLDEWTQILIIVDSPIGDAIYASLQNKTQALKDLLGVDQIPNIPYVTLDSRPSLRARNDLLQTVCDLYTGDKPPECTAVKVEIYYETLNAKSRKFFLEELRPTFENYREGFTVDFIPYGRTNATGDGNQTIYTCPSIDDEEQCFANLLQACAIKHFLHSDDNANSLEYDGKNQTLWFIWCMFKNENNQPIAALAESCADQIFVVDEWVWRILECARSDEGQEIMMEMHGRTLNIADELEHVPWIVVNGARSALAETELLQVVCDSQLGDRAAICFIPRAPQVAVEFHYQTGDVADQQYFLNELYPNYRALEEVINLEPIPFGQTNAVLNSNGSWTFTCPNGPNECIGNRLHACVYSAFWHNDDDYDNDNNDIDGKLQTLEFMRCYFNSSNWPNNPYSAAEPCIAQNFIDIWPRILECARDPPGEWVFAALLAKVNALSPPLTYTPWLTVNGRHSQSAELHFARTICDSYTGLTKPALCYGLAPQMKPVVQINYEPLNQQTRLFVMQQLNASLNNTLEEIADLVLLPYGRTQRNGNGMDAVFTCSNATDNCHTLREHACVISNFYQNYTLQTLNWLYCTFARDDWLNVPTVTDECINENFLDSVTIIEVCADQVVSNQSTVILNSYADTVAALNPPLTHVPWILINGAHNLAAEQNLIQEICDVYYPDDKPPQCIVQLLPVSIFYETMSQPVADFVVSNIGPYYQYFDDISILSLVPYGLTTRNGSQFSCVQDPLQCEANRIHACVVHYFFESGNQSVNDDNTRQETLQWLNCTFSNNISNPINDAEICLNQIFHFDDWPMVDICARGPEGTDIYGQMADLTEQLVPPIGYVPVVTINGTQNTNAESNNYLVHSICDSYSPLKPTICKTISIEPVSVALYYQADQRSANFIVNQLYQFYVGLVPIIPTLRATSLQSIIDVQFIPWGQTVYNNDNPDTPFTCPAGTNQCHLNRIHACAINQYLNNPNGLLQIIEFIICTFQQPNWPTDPSTAGNECANNVWFPDPWFSIEPCANFETDVYLAFGNQTLLLDPPLTDVPWILINGIKSTEAETNLIGVVCNSYQGPLPDQCLQFTGTPSTPTSPGTTPSSGMPSTTTPSGSPSATPPSTSSGTPSSTPTTSTVTTSSTTLSTPPSTPSTVTTTPTSTPSSTPSTPSVTTTSTTTPSTPSVPTTSSTTPTPSVPTTSPTTPTPSVTTTSTTTPSTSTLSPTPSTSISSGTTSIGTTASPITGPITTPLVTTAPPQTTGPVTTASPGTTPVTTPVTTASPTSPTTPSLNGTTATTETPTTQAASYKLINYYLLMTVVIAFLFM